MINELISNKTDDPQFIRVVTSVVEGLLTETKPEELYVVAIDNWFDHKWLKFSGKGIVDFEFPSFMNEYDCALAEFHQDNLTVAPFPPSRVKGQSYFRRDKNATYGQAEPLARLHSSEREHSGKNLQRRIRSVSHSGNFVWYSSNTIVNARASIMTYTVKDGQTQAWFAAFRKSDSWKLYLTKGINRDRVQELMVSKNSTEGTTILT